LGKGYREKGPPPLKIQRNQPTEHCESPLETKSNEKTGGSNGGWVNVGLEEGFAGPQKILKQAVEKRRGGLKN